MRRPPSPQAVSDARRSPSGCRTCGWCNPPGPRSPPRTPGCFRTSSSPGPASTDSTSPAGTIRRNNRPVGAFPHLVALPRALDTRPRQAAVKPSTEWGAHFHLKNGKRGRLMSRLLTHSHPHVLAEPLLADLGPEQEGWRRAAPSAGGTTCSPNTAHWTQQVVSASSALRSNLICIVPVPRGSVVSPGAPDGSLFFSDQGGADAGICGAGLVTESPSFSASLSGTTHGPLGRVGMGDLGCLTHTVLLVRKGRHEAHLGGHTCSTAPGEALGPAGWPHPGGLTLETGHKAQRTGQVPRSHNLIKQGAAGIYGSPALVW